MPTLLSQYKRCRNDWSRYKRIPFKPCHWCTRRVEFVKMSSSWNVVVVVVVVVVVAAAAGNNDSDGRFVILIFCPVTIQAADHSGRRGLRHGTVSARSNTGIVGSNPTLIMDVYLRLFYVYVVLRVGIFLLTCWSPSKESSRRCID
jgi:hypothetical protein